jgi:hypothetical protein
MVVGPPENVIDEDDSDETLPSFPPSVLNLATSHLTLSLILRRILSSEWTSMERLDAVVVEGRSYK